MAPEAVTAGGRAPNIAPGRRSQPAPAAARRKTGRSGAPNLAGGEGLPGGCRRAGNNSSLAALS